MFIGMQQRTFFNSYYVRIVRKTSYHAPHTAQHIDIRKKNITDSMLSIVSNNTRDRNINNVLESLEYYRSNPEITFR
ncbi:Uncharacterized protein FWK35_00018173 [Aphis craccivora]|uniref:Uncharacterized protein n=1 Tax=Aphis craccivora TaxID=307492 RepID=A0A6G0Y735_APHCR|nr:Uncharacterized protein FWK35_00018173 [Aphis craccivora]